MHNDLQNEKGFSGPQFSVLPESLAAGMRTGRTSKIERIRHVLEGRKEAGPRWEHEVRIHYFLLCMYV
jgi:hypothetical protein